MGDRQTAVALRREELVGRLGIARCHLDPSVLLVASASFCRPRLAAARTAPSLRPRRSPTAAELRRMRRPTRSKRTAGRVASSVLDSQEPRVGCTASAWNAREFDPGCGPAPPPASETPLRPRDRGLTSAQDRLECSEVARSGAKWGMRP